MTPQVEENAENTDFVLMYKCKNDECPKSVWIICKGFTVKESNCSSCKISCSPMHADDMNDKQYAWFDGKLRSFGSYKCKDCKKNWSSGNSWVDKWQACHTCGNKIYPHNMRPLGKPRYGKRREKKKHERSTCEKCTNINDLCLKMQAFNMSDSSKKVKKEKKNNADEQKSN